MVIELKDVPLDTLRAPFRPDRFVLGRLEEAAGDSLRVAVEVVDPATYGVVYVRSTSST